MKIEAGLLEAKDAMFKEWLPRNPRF